MPFIFVNNLSTTLAAPLASGATTCTLASGTNVPIVVAPNVLKLTITEGANQEIIHVTAATAGNPVLTIVRAQEGTASPASFSTQAVVEARLTKGIMDSLGQISSALTATRVPFAGTGGLLGDNANFTYTVGTGLKVNDATPSTSSSTGAMVVAGGVGIGGSTFIGGNLGVGTSADGQGHYIQIIGNTILDRAPFLSLFRVGAREFIQGVASNGIFIFANTGGGTGYTDAALIAAANLCITSLGKIGINTTAPSAVLEVLGDIKSTSPTAGIGYGTGAGGAVTQLTSKATGVTLNNVCGTITLNNAALAANTSVAFILTDSAIAATDLLVIVHDSVGTLGAYGITATPAAGSATVTVRNNTGGALSEAIVLRFALIKAVVA